MLDRYANYCDIRQQVAYMGVLTNVKGSQKNETSILAAFF